MDEHSRTPRAPSYRRRFIAGLAAAALLAVAVGAWLLGQARAAESRQRAERTAVITLNALAEVVERAGGGEAAAEEGGLGFEDEIAAAAGEEPPAEETGGLGIGDEIAAEIAAAEAAPTADPGEAVRRAVARFDEAHPAVEAIRVVTFEGIRLEASTAASDTGEQAPPRRLAREEKPLYDRGQRLRAAVESNRGAESPREREIEVEPLRTGGLSLAAPVERGGEVVGMVEMETAPAPSSPGPGWAVALLAFVAPVVLFLPLALASGERRWLLAAVAAILLVGTILGFGRFALGTLEADQRTTAEAAAARIREEAGLAAAALAAAGAPAELDAAAWDSDLFRRPREVLSASGEIDEARLAATGEVSARRLTRAVLVIGLVSLALLAFVGLGAAARVRSDLVRYRQAYAYTLPAMAGMLVLVFFPFLYGLALSFTNANIYNSDESIFETWVGLGNFVDILGDFDVARRTADDWVFNYGNFYWTLFFTIAWTISNVAIGVSLGLLLALALNTKGLAFRPIYRVILVLPWAMPNYITALIFRGMFHQQFGAVNHVIQIFGGEPVSWFDGPLTSFAAVVTTNGWLSFPFMMVVSLGALQSIPADLYEAARVDGASRWQQFRSITLPSLKPALVPAVILSVIWTFNMFNIIYLVSAGEPAGATEILITRAYKLAFEQYRYGYAAAYSTVIFLILLAYGTWQNRVTRATEAIG